MAGQTVYSRMTFCTCCLLSLWALARTTEWLHADNCLLIVRPPPSPLAGEQLIAISLNGDVARSPLALNRSTSGSGGCAARRVVTAYCGVSCCIFFIFDPTTSKQLNALRLEDHYQSMLQLEMRIGVEPNNKYSGTVRFGQPYISGSVRIRQLYGSGSIRFGRRHICICIFCK